MKRNPKTQKSKDCAFYRLPEGALISRVAHGWYVRILKRTFLTRFVLMVISMYDIAKSPSNLYSEISACATSEEVVW